MSCGSATVPIAAAVATEEPEIAANSAQPAMLVCSRPPGMTQTSFDRPRYIRKLRPECCMISAIRMNSGIAVSAKLFIEPQLIRPMPWSEATPPCSSR